MSQNIIKLVGRIINRKIPIPPQLNIEKVEIIPAKAPSKTPFNTAFFFTFFSRIFIDTPKKSIARKNPNMPIESWSANPVNVLYK